MAASLRTYKLISIAGLANSGKDTVAHMLNYLLNAPKCFRSYF
jgi:uridine kinase